MFMGLWFYCHKVSVVTWWPANVYITLLTSFILFIMHNVIEHVLRNGPLYNRVSISWLSNVPGSISQV